MKQNRALTFYAFAYLAFLYLPVLVLPLTVPVLIFGVTASNAAITGLSFGAPFMILCALTLGSLVLGPFAAASGKIKNVYVVRRS